MARLNAELPRMRPSRAWQRRGALVDPIRALAAGDPSGYVRAEAQRFLDGVRVARKNAVDRVPPA